MESTMKIEIHHGGEFSEKCGIKYYKGGKVDYIYNQCLDIVSIAMFRYYVKHDLGYKDFKLYWYKGSFDEMGCRLIWNDEIFEEIYKHASMTGNIHIYVDHAHETDGVEESGQETYGEEKDVGEDSASGEDSEYDESDEDSEYDESDVGNISDSDEEFKEVMLNRKEVYKSKMNPRGEDDVNIPLRTVLSQEKKQKKINKVQNVTGVDQSKDVWDSEYESDSNNSLELDSSDNEEVRSVKKKRQKKTDLVNNTFNPKTPMKYIKFEVGLVFTSVQDLRNAIIDYAVEQKRDICYKKNDLQRVQAKCSQNCPWYLFASRIHIDGAFQVKTYNGHHSCSLVNKHSFLRSEWLARRFGNKIRANPKWKLREFQQHLNELHGLLIKKNLDWGG